MGGSEVSTQATGTFEGKTWDEAPYSEVDGGAKLARASVTNVFSGGVEGEGTLEYLLVYGPDGSGGFVGFEQVVGSIGGRSGSFALRHEGTFEGSTVKATWSVVPGSGAGELAGLRGEGGFVSEHGTPQTPFTLDHDFE